MPHANVCEMSCVKGQAMQRNVFVTASFREGSYERTN